MLQDGLWAEVTIAYNEIEDDAYAFYVEDLRPIQLSRFDFNRYCEGRSAFSRDAWIDIILRSVGLEPTVLSHRLKLHFIARLFPLVEPNFNLSYITIPSPIYHVFLLSDYNHANESLRRKTWTSS